MAQRYADDSKPGVSSPPFLCLCVCCVCASCAGVRREDVRENRRAVSSLTSCFPPGSESRSTNKKKREEGSSAVRTGDCTNVRTEETLLRAHSSEPESLEELEPRSDRYKQNSESIEVSLQEVHNSHDGQREKRVRER